MPEDPVRAMRKENINITNRVSGKKNIKGRGQFTQERNRRDQTRFGVSYWIPVGLITRK